jgi:alpha-glucosidase
LSQNRNGGQEWWRDAVVYQVYLRSFADGNGDGTGDIAGLRSRLPYLETLGVDAIWVNPWYESPLNDGGYDVADYRKISPLFGTLDEAELLIAEAHEHGLRILVDLVPNHTSSEHRWFQEALSSEPDSPARDRYHFLRGAGPDGSAPPNDWRSVFGGPAWSRVPDGEWYLHLFDVTQPDLNWDNREVRDEFRSILRFWLDLGADGFRVDVAHSLAKDPSYADLGEQTHELDATPHTEHHPFWDRPELHEIVREWRHVLNGYNDRMMVAEAWLPSWDRMVDYLRPGEYHQAFDFLFLQAPWDATAMSEAIEEALTTSATVQSKPSWVLSNHDVVRHATRYGLPQDLDAKEWLLDGERSLLDESRGLLRARAAALMMLALPGAVYLYQGEELGLPEVHDLPFDVLQDPVWEDSRHSQKGRDGCRVPIPWKTDGPSFGFGDGGSWLPQPEDWGRRSVEAQEGVAGSTLQLYREAIRLRRGRLRAGNRFIWVERTDDVVAFERSGGIECVINFGPDPLPLPDGEVLLASGDLIGGSLPTDTAAWIARRSDD